MPATATLITTEELFAMPDDGIDRELIRGELREKPMTKRDRYHSHVTTRVAKLLDNWLDLQPLPRGQVLAVEVLSPSDTHKHVVEKVGDYLRTGVAVVWVIDPDFQLVHVHQRGVPAETCNVNQELPTHPALPGLQVRVCDLFRV